MSCHNHFLQEPVSHAVDEESFKDAVRFSSPLQSKLSAADSLCLASSSTDKVSSKSLL